MIGTELLKGQGLGNQLFCYVTTRCIAMKQGRDFSILGSETLANNIHSSCGLYFMDLDFGIQADKNKFAGTYYERDDRIYTGSSRHDLTHGCYVTAADEEMFSVKDNMLLFGNMQAEEYYIAYKEQIKQWLKVKPEYDCYDYSKEDLCVLHLRCSDYMDSPELFLRKKYWLDGMKHMRKMNPDMKFMIITNDVKEANKFLPGVPAYNFDLAKDYSILKNARYLLLANSSFAYFPAFTSDRDPYIIAPKYWASEQNIYSGWHYMDRKGRVFTDEECRQELNEYKKKSRRYRRLNVHPGKMRECFYKIQSKCIYANARLRKITRGVIRRIKAWKGR